MGSRIPSVLSEMLRQAAEQQRKEARWSSNSYYEQPPVSRSEVHEMIAEALDSIADDLVRSDGGQ